jgi:MHS family shikimate/dehydroshikimate transporter-like MFS transporter
MATGQAVIPPGGTELTKVAVASSVGTFIDWYDFLLSGVCAATVYPLVFFNFTGVGSALALGIATWGLGFLARPVGAFLFGQWGDRRGRRSTLLLTLCTMGVGTLGISLTPSFGMIGGLAPALVIIFRLFQGVGMGGEWGGAATFISEHAGRSKWKTLWNSGMQASVVIGFGVAVWLLTTIAGLTGGWTGTSFLSWGWRIGFWVGALIILLGAIIRYYTMESPLFTDLQQRKALKSAPAAEAWRHYPLRMIKLGVAWCWVIMGFSFLWVPYVLPYAGAVGISATGIYYAELASCAAMAFTAFLGAYIADKWVRRKYVMAFSAISSAVMAYPMFVLIQTGNDLNAILGMVLFTGFMNLGYGCVSSLYAEQFPTEFRQSGAGQGYNLGALIDGSASTFFVPWVLAAFGLLSGWSYVLIVYLIAAVIAAIVAVSLYEPKRTPVPLVSPPAKV